MSRVVAIDGPSGSGKSTVARAVGAQLDLDVLDTGAMYRAVALAVLEAGVDLADGRAISVIAGQARVHVDGGATALGGRDVSEAIRAPDVTGAVSTVAAHPEVRRLLVQQQRSWVESRDGGVVEGRDIGTVVFPDAAVKVFLTATDEERARRRARDEEKAERSTTAELEQRRMAERDERDSSRDVSPLQPADDATIIDTTGRDVSDVAAQVVAHYRGRLRHLA